VASDTLLYDRICKLRLIDTQTKIAKEFVSKYREPSNPKNFAKGFRISFKLEKAIDSNPNKGEIRIYNLKKTSRDLAERRDNVIVECLAGYGETPKLLFSGYVGRVITTTDGPDNITSFELGDGLKGWQEASVDQAFKPGTGMTDIFTSLIGSFGSSQGEVKDVPAETVLNGLSLSGNSRDHMDNLCSRLGLQWNITDGKVNVFKKGGSIGPTTALLLTKDTGLIGSPQKKDKQKLELISLLQPGFNPGNLVKVEAKFVTGTFIANKVIHEGDTDDKPWYTKIEV